MDIALRLLLGCFLFGFTGWITYFLFGILELVFNGTAFAAGVGVRKLFRISGTNNTFAKLAVGLVSLAKGLYGFAIFTAIFMYSFFFPRFQDASGIALAIALAMLLLLWAPSMFILGIVGLWSGETAESAATTPIPNTEVTRPVKASKARAAIPNSIEPKRTVSLPLPVLVGGAAATVALTAVFAAASLYILGHRSDSGARPGEDDAQNTPSKTAQVDPSTATIVSPSPTVFASTASTPANAPTQVTVPATANQQTVATATAPVAPTPSATLNATSIATVLPTSTSLPSPSPTLKPGPSATATSVATSVTLSQFTWWEANDSGQPDFAKPVPPSHAFLGICIRFYSSGTAVTQNVLVILQRGGVILRAVESPSLALTEGYWNWCHVGLVFPGSTIDVVIYANGIDIGRSSILVP